MIADFAYSMVKWTTKKFTTVYYRPKMTFGAKMANIVKNRGVIYYRKFTTAIGPWWHLEIFEVFLAEKKTVRDAVVKVPWIGPLIKYKYSEKKY